MTTNTLVATKMSKTGLSTAETVELRAQILYPAILLLAFIASAGVHSVLTSRTEEELVAPIARGPGGKPLPLTKRKREHEESIVPQINFFSDAARRVFQYATGAIIITFLANAVAIALHAIEVRTSSGGTSGWWCGEERIVSHFSSQWYCSLLTTFHRSMLSDLPSSTSTC